MAGLRVHFVMPPELVARIDAAKGEASRGEFVRAAVEVALNAGWKGPGIDGAVERALGESGAGAVDERPAPAEQPPDTRAMDLLREDDPDPDWLEPPGARFLRSSAHVKRGVAPIPKGKP